MAYRIGLERGKEVGAKKSREQVIAEVVSGIEPPSVFNLEGARNIVVEARYCVSINGDGNIAYYISIPGSFRVIKDGSGCFFLQP